MVAQPTYLSRAVPGGIPDDIIRELCARLFACLPRNDQRRKGEQYVRGLLSASGRKSMRNVARIYGGRSVEQSLHHFISGSTWDWHPVRESLAGHLRTLARPQAWVVRPMVIPKAGTRSIGVERRFVAELGQVVNSQQAFGGWLATEELSVPINWRLVLSAGRCRDQDRPPPGGIPADSGDTPAECAGGAALDLAAGTLRSCLPVVMDVGEIDAVAMARRFAAADVPLLVRIGAATRLIADDRAVPGEAGREFPAHHIVDMVKTLRRPVYWLDPSRQVIRTSFVAAVQVRAPWPAGGRRRRLRLLTEWEDRRPWPSSFWLTDLAEPPGALLRLARLTRRVDRDFAEVSERVGVRDFEGRSFQGWHRHVTLASAAHTAAVLATAGVPSARLVQDGWS
jgi:hypothetical protein